MEITKKKRLQKRGEKVLIEQHYEKDGIRFTMQLQTLNALTHKLVSEDEELVRAAKNIMYSAAPEIQRVLNHERVRRNLE